MKRLVTLIVGVALCVAPSVVRASPLDVELRKRDATWAAGRVPVGVTPRPASVAQPGLDGVRPVLHEGTACDGLGTCIKLEPGTLYDVATTPETSADGGRLVLIRRPGDTLLYFAREKFFRP